MKLKNILFASAFAIGITMMAGCSKSKFDINSNPDDVTDESVTPSVLLPGALQATSTNIGSEWWFLDWWLGHGARSGSYQSLNEEETYSFTNDFHVSIWNTLYGNANNYQILINKSMEAGAGTYEAIGRIMKSHNFQMLVDIYGNVPYTDAFKGTAVPTPKYDKAVDIYNAIFADLDKAIELLNDDAASDLSINTDIAVSDFAFKGNRAQWRKVANTLRLRMLIHLHNGLETTTVAPGVDVAAQVAKFTSDGFLGAGESLQINPGFTGTKPQPYFRFYNTNETGTASQRDYLRASDYAIRYYKADGDPRIDRFYELPSGATTHAGIIFGTPSSGTAPIGSALSSIRGIGLSPNGAASRAWIITAAESLFLQAEARERGLITTGPTAAELLTAAVTENFVWLGLTATDATDYLDFNAGYPDVDYTAAPRAPGLPGGGIYTIIQQKWFALNAIAPYEVWSDYRRTGITYGIGGQFDAGPTISVDPNNNETEIPVRLFYPQNEYNYNAANVGAEGTIDVFTTKIFWDLN